MIGRPTRSTRTDTLLADTTLFRSRDTAPVDLRAADERSLADQRQYVAARSGAADRDARARAAFDRRRPARDRGAAAARVRQRRGFLEKRRAQGCRRGPRKRSEEHTSELQSLMRISYAVFCLKKKKQRHKSSIHSHQHGPHRAHTN